MPKAAVPVESPESVAPRRREPAVFYRRIQRKLGTKGLQSDQDLAHLVEQRLPLSSVESLTSHGLSDDEIYKYVVPRRTLVHRRSKSEPLTHDESDRAVRIARITSSGGRDLWRRCESRSLAA